MTTGRAQPEKPGRAANNQHRRRTTELDEEHRARMAEVETNAADLAEQHRRRTAELDEEHRARMAEVEASAVELADETLPELVRRLRGGQPMDTALRGLSQPSGEHKRLFESIVEAMTSLENARRAGLSACGTAAARIQSLTETLHGELKAMHGDIGDNEDLLGKLFELDNLTVQATRIADRIAVLTGARSGRPWTKPITVENIVRGAMSRIDAYDRVRLHSSSKAAIFGYAARHVINALAELLDNATKFSPPTDAVHVYVEEPAIGGVVVTIDDSGLGLDPAERQLAERAVSGEQELADVSGARLGLAVVGLLGPTACSLGTSRSGAVMPGHGGVVD